MEVRTLYKASLCHSSNSPLQPAVLLTLQAVVGGTRLMRNCAQLSHPHTHTHIPSLSPTHPHTHTLTHTPSLSPTHPHTHILTYIPSPTHPHPHTLTHIPSPTHSHPHTLTHIPSPTHPHHTPSLHTFNHSETATVKEVLADVHKLLVLLQCLLPASKCLQEQKVVTIATRRHFGTHLCMYWKFPKDKIFVKNFCS